MESKLIKAGSKRMRTLWEVRQGAEVGSEVSAR